MPIYGAAPAGGECNNIDCLMEMLMKSSDEDYVCSPKKDDTSDEDFSPTNKKNKTTKPTPKSRRRTSLPSNTTYDSSFETPNISCKTGLSH